VVKPTVVPLAGQAWEQANRALDQTDSEYVVFLPSGRAPLPGALERLHDLGAARNADVVVGRAGGCGPMAQRFPDSLPATAFVDDRSVDRLVRTEFLRDREIRFRALGELSGTGFAVELLLADPATATDLDQVSSRWTEQSAEPTAGLLLSPAAYGAGLRQILDMIETGTAPGPRRDSFTVALWEHQVVRRLGRQELVTLPSAQAWSLLDEARRACVDRVPIALDEGLGPVLAALAALIRSGVPEEIAELATQIDQVQPRAWVTSLASIDSAAVEIGVEAGLLARTRPLSLRAGAGGWLLPATLTGGNDGVPTAVDDSAELAAEVVMRHRRTMAEVVLTTDLSATMELVGESGELVWSGAARFDADSDVAGYRLTEGQYDLLVRVRAWRLQRESKLSVAGLDEDQIPILIGTGDRVEQFRITRRGHLGLAIGAHPSSVLKRFRTSRVVPSRRHIMVETDVRDESGYIAVTLSMTSAAGGARTSARLTAGPSPGQWTATPRRSWLSLRSGRYSASLTVVRPGAEEEPSQRHRVRLVQPVVISPSVVAGWLAHLVVRGSRTRLRQWVRRAAREVRRLRRRGTRDAMHGTPDL
jgi:hypothetical protein